MQGSEAKQNIAMLRIAIGLFLAVLGPLALEHYMSSLPEWIWRTIALICIASGLVVVADSHFLKPYWSDYKNFPLASTAIVSVATAIIVGSPWCLFVLKLPDSQKTAAESAERISEALMGSQIQEVRELQKFIGGKDESELRELFDFPAITKFNIRLAKR